MDIRSHIPNQACYVAIMSDNLSGSLDTCPSFKTVDGFKISTLDVTPGTSTFQSWHLTASTT